MQWLSYFFWLFRYLQQRLQLCNSLLHLSQDRSIVIMDHVPGLRYDLLYLLTNFINVPISEDQQYHASGLIFFLIFPHAWCSYYKNSPFEDDWRLLR